jgi:hypothetical protein
VKVEADGDLHLALRDATGDKPGIVVVEVPSKPQWCEIRTTVFSWTRRRFPLHIQSTRTLNLGGDAPLVTVIGKAFWDVGHAPKDQSNRRKYLPDYAVWEISSGDETGRSVIARDLAQTEAGCVSGFNLLPGFVCNRPAHTVRRSYRRPLFCTTKSFGNSRWELGEKSS